MCSSATRLFAPDQGEVNPQRPPATSLKSPDTDAHKHGAFQQLRPDAPQRCGEVCIFQPDRDFRLCLVRTHLPRRLRLVR